MGGWPGGQLISRASRCPPDEGYPSRRRTGDRRTASRRAPNPPERCVDCDRDRPGRAGRDPRFHPAEPRDRRGHLPGVQRPPPARGGPAVLADPWSRDRGRIWRRPHTAAPDGGRPGAPQVTELVQTGVTEPARPASAAGPPPKPKPCDPEVTDTRATEPPSAPVVAPGPAGVLVAPRHPP